MRKLAFLIIAGLVLSCNNASKETKTDSKDTGPGATGEAPKYPYKIEHPDNWDIGSTANTMTALSALKAWEEKKIDESARYFADSIEVMFDGLHKKVPNDSLKVMFSNLWSQYKTVKVDMKDWESVISKDKSEEWVTLWYTEHWETTGGGIDSASYINDLKLKNNKIVTLAEYTRKFH